MPTFIPFAAEGGVDVGALPIRLPELFCALVEDGLELEELLLLLLLLLLEADLTHVSKPLVVLAVGADEKSVLFGVLCVVEAVTEVTIG